MEENLYDLLDRTGFDYSDSRGTGILLDQDGNIIACFDDPENIEGVKMFVIGYIGGYETGFGRGKKIGRLETTVDDVIDRKFESMGEKFDEWLQRHACISPGPRD